MDYFILQQDERYVNTPFIKDLASRLDRRKISREGAGDIPDIFAVFVEDGRDNFYTDVLDRQIFIIREEMKELFEKYERDALFKTIVLIDKEKVHQEIYYLPIFDEVDCISHKSTFNMDGSIVKNLVVKEEELRGRSIVKVKYDKTRIILVRLDVAESLLRRELQGIKLTRAETI